MKTMVILLSIWLIFIFKNTEACGCKKWCRIRGRAWGKCGDGHTCICTDGPGKLNLNVLI